MPAERRHDKQVGPDFARLAHDRSTVLKARNASGERCCRWPAWELPSGCWKPAISIYWVNGAQYQALRALRRGPNDLTRRCGWCEVDGMTMTARFASAPWKRRAIPDAVPAWCPRFVQCARCRRVRSVWRKSKPFRARLRVPCGPPDV